MASKSRERMAGMKACDLRRLWPSVHARFRVALFQHVWKRHYDPDPMMRLGYADANSSELYVPVPPEVVWDWYWKYGCRKGGRTMARRRTA